MYAYCLVLSKSRFDMTHHFFSCLEQTEGIVPGMIWCVWTWDISLHGWSFCWVEYCFYSISRRAKFQKFHGGLGGKILTLPTLWFHLYRSAKISNIWVAGLSEGFVSFSSVSLCYRTSLPSVTFWINSAGFPPFFQQWNSHFLLFSSFSSQLQVWLVQSVLKYDSLC